MRHVLVFATVPIASPAPDLSTDERYHARLAYRTLRCGQPYCSTLLQQSRFACAENSLALTQLKADADIPDRRTRRREAQGVEGTHGLDDSTEHPDPAAGDVSQGPDLTVTDHRDDKPTID